MPKFRIFATVAMDQQALHESIKQVSTRITEEDISLLVSCAVPRELRKGDTILKEGEVCRSFYLVEKGYLRTFCNNKDGVTINLNFTFEGDFTSNLKSLQSRKPSEFNIEAGEDASVWIFHVDSLKQKLDSSTAVSLFVRGLAIRVLQAADEHGNLFKMYSPAERYHYMEKNNPRLLQRISLSQMASYLGVARETLSRIRAKSSQG